MMMPFERMVDGPDEAALWAQVRVAYEAGELSISEIAAAFGVSRSAILWRAKRDLWRRGNKKTNIATDRQIIIRRLFRMLEMQVMHLEMEMDDMTETESRSGEREIELLGKLAANLDKLVKLDGVASAPSKRRERTAKEIADMRNKLARRLDELKRG
jgi:hypothetical protein